MNLNISVPVIPQPKLLPVLIWIHGKSIPTPNIHPIPADTELGGSQVVSFPPVSHRFSDTTALISKSCLDDLPMIVVTFNYRLNIFGFGDGSEKNLALKDQRLAIEWVVKHIAGFGGDKVRPLFITVSLSTKRRMLIK